MVVCGLPVFAQIDSSALRAKFGSPMSRETFHMPAGFDMVVDYGASNYVCRLEVPSLMPTQEKVSNLEDMTKKMYLFLEELVPASMRGKELGKMMQTMGLSSLVTTEYEHVTVSESQRTGESFGHNNRITLIFKSETCR
jgi:hypothetical protein